MKNTYEACLRRLLAHEGGYTNHPSDPGGPTNFGITIGDYRRYINPKATSADVRDMTVEEAKGIYRRRYWDAQRCDELPAGVDYATFDYGVNSGVGRSGKVLRRALKLPDNSSVVSDAVIAAARSADARVLVGTICDERLRFLQSLKTWPVFGKGWGRRVSEVRSFALAMIADTSAPQLPQSPVQGRGVPPVSGRARQGVAGATAAAGTLAALHAHRSGIRPIFIAAILVATVAITLFVWLFWQWRQRRWRESPA
jgi:lysozyme family protein